MSREETEPPESGLLGPDPESRERPVGRRNSQGIRIDPETEAAREPRRTTITALVANEPGVLSKVTGLFSRRQYNIESLTAPTTQNPDWSRIPVVVEEPHPNIDQIEKQLDKLVLVIHTRALARELANREPVLLKMPADEPSTVHPLTEMPQGPPLHPVPPTTHV